MSLPFRVPTGGELVPCGGVVRNSRGQAIGHAARSLSPTDQDHDFLLSRKVCGEARGCAGDVNMEDSFIRESIQPKQMIGTRGRASRAITSSLSDSIPPLYVLALDPAQIWEREPSPDQNLDHPAFDLVPARVRRSAGRVSMATRGATFPCPFELRVWILPLHASTSRPRPRLSLCPLSVARSTRRWTCQALRARSLPTSSSILLAPGPSRRLLLNPGEEIRAQNWTRESFASRRSWLPALRSGRWHCIETRRARVNVNVVGIRSD